MSSSLDDEDASIFRAYHYKMPNKIKSASRFRLGIRAYRLSGVIKTQVSGITDTVDV